jgi:hypothetical protein
MLERLTMPRGRRPTRLEGGLPRRIVANSPIHQQSFVGGGKTSFCETPNRELLLVSPAVRTKLRTRSRNFLGQRIGNI